MNSNASAAERRGARDLSTTSCVRTVCPNWGGAVESLGAHPTETPTPFRAQGPSFFGASFSVLRLVDSVETLPPLRGGRSPYHVRSSVRLQGVFHKENAC